MTDGTHLTLGASEIHNCPFYCLLTAGHGRQPLAHVPDGYTSFLDARENKMLYNNLLTRLHCKAFVGCMCELSLCGGGGGDVCSTGL